MVDITDLVGESYKVVKNNPKMLIPYILLTLVLSAYLVPSAYFVSSGTFSIGLFLSGLIILIIVVFFVGVLLSGFYINLGIQGLNGRKVSFSAALKTSKQRYWAMLWTSILVILINLAIFILLALPFVPLLLSIAHSAPTGTGALVIKLLGAALLLILLYVITGVILVILFFQTFVLVIVEKMSGLAAIRRSVDICWKNFGNIFLLLLLLVIIFVAVYIVADIIAAIVGLVNSGAGVGLRYVLNAIIGGFVDTLYPVIAVSFYNNYVGKKATKRR